MFTILRPVKPQDFIQAQHHEFYRNQQPCSPGTYTHGLADRIFGFQPWKGSQQTSAEQGWGQQLVYSENARFFQKDKDRIHNSIT